MEDLITILIYLFVILLAVGAVVLVIGGAFAISPIAGIIVLAIYLFR